MKTTAWKGCLVLVLGKQPLPDGTMSPQFAAQMAEAVRIMYEQLGALLVLSGGKTLHEFPPEAELALRYVPTNLHARTYLESRSLSTKQNIENVRELCAKLDLSVMKLVLVSTPAHRMQAMYLVKHYWREVFANCEYHSAGKSDAAEWLSRGAIYLMQVLDPKEKFFLPIKRRLVGRSHRAP